MFNPAITTTATRGYYVVYLFSADMARLYLTLNQGTTAIEQEFKSRYLPELERRAQLGNARLGKLPAGMSKAAIDLASSGTLPDGYEAGHVCGYSYDLTNLPSEAVLARHLREILSSYLTLDTLGGLTDLPTADDDDVVEGDSVDERRRYRRHRSIERNPSTSRKVKKAQGYICQGCSFDFEKVYGEIGHQYIEAHHLFVQPCRQERPVQARLPDQGRGLDGRGGSRLGSTNSWFLRIAHGEDEAGARRDPGGSRGGGTQRTRSPAATPSARSTGLSRRTSSGPMRPTPAARSTAIAQIDFSFSFSASPADFNLMTPDALLSLGITWTLGPGSDEVEDDVEIPQT